MGDVIPVKKQRKNAVVGETGYKRREHDFYATEPWVTWELIKAVPMNNALWEPACGDGAIVRELRKAGYNVFASDLIDHGFEGEQLQLGVDFLKADLPAPYVRTIVTNPPFGDAAEAFVRHALDLMMPVQGAVIMLQRNDWDLAKTRRSLFEDMPFIEKIALRRRPRWVTDIPKSEQKSPRFSYAWYVWDWGQDRPIYPSLRYAA